MLPEANAVITMLPVGAEFEVVLNRMFPVSVAPAVPPEGIVNASAGVDFTTVPTTTVCGADVLGAF